MQEAEITAAAPEAAAIREAARTVTAAAVKTVMSETAVPDISRPKS